MPYQGKYIIFDDRGVQAGRECSSEYEARCVVDDLVRDNTQFGVGA